MTTHEDQRVTTWRLLATGEDAEMLARIPPDPGVAQIASLRKRWPRDSVHAAIELARGRDRAKRKFGAETASRLWCDPEGVEMASSPLAAAYKARRFTNAFGHAARVVDLCCGIGGDLMGLKGGGLDPVGVDSDPCRAWMASMNASCETLAADVLDARVPDHPFHLDPSRRSVSGRTRHTGSFDPPPGVWDRILERCETGCIKLNPGADASELPDGELEIVSERGRLTLALVWTGVLAGVTRRATRLDHDGAVTIAGEPGRLDEQHPIDAWVATMDPSVERAQLVTQLTRPSGTRQVHPGAGLLTGQTPIDHPMLAWFRVLDTLVYDETAIRRALEAHDAGAIEVKTRDKIVDPDTLQNRLRGAGERTLTLFVLRFGRERRAILTQRVRAAATETLHPCTGDTPC